MSISLGALIGDQDDLERQPLVIRQSSPTENHTRFQENQNAQAFSLLRSGTFAGLTLLIALALLTVWWSYYIRGWSAWINHSEKPCDQPLAKWLLAMLLFPLFLWILDHKEHGLRLFMIFMTTAVMVAGFYMFLETESCAETNPGLYAFVREYLIFLAIWHSFWTITNFIFIALIVYGLRNGWFDEIMNDSASPETIDRLETVDYDPALFAQAGVAGDNRPAPECCICTEPFASDQRNPIKRTACQHFFHKDCLENWLKRAKTCPLCRNDLEASASAPADSSGAPKDQVINRGALFSDPGATVPPGNVPGSQV